MPRLHGLRVNLVISPRLLIGPRRLLPEHTLSWFQECMFSPLVFLYPNQRLSILIDMLSIQGLRTGRQVKQVPLDMTRKRNELLKNLVSPASATLGRRVTDLSTHFPLLRFNLCEKGGLKTICIVSTGSVKHCKQYAEIVLLYLTIIYFFYLRDLFRCRP